MIRSFTLQAAAELSVWEKIAVWYQESVFYDLLTYLQERYFRLEFGAYDNFSVPESAANTMQTMIFAVFLGLILASATVAYTRTKLGRFVSKLVRNDCLSPEKAKNLMELGEFRNSLVRRELSRGINLRKIVRCPEEEAYRKSEESTIYQVPDDLGVQAAASEKKSRRKKSEKPYPMDFTKDRFYLPEELKYRAEVRYERKGSTWLFFFGAVVLSVAVMILLYRFLPDLFRLADNLISWAAPQE